MPKLTATLIAYYHTCPRKLWLHAQDIALEQSSDLVYEGKLIGENSYPERAAKGTQLELQVALDERWTGTAKIDYYDARSKTVHETKKSDKMEQAHRAQVQYYLYLLIISGIDGARGVIEYPRLRERTQVELSAAEYPQVEAWIKAIQGILEQDKCPPLLHKPLCKKCAYYEFCYTEELEYA